MQHALVHKWAEYLQSVLRGKQNPQKFNKKAALCFAGSEAAC